MKKFAVLIILLLIATVILTSCASSTEFKYAYIKIDDAWIDVEIVKYHKTSYNDICLTLKDGNIILINTVNCILHNGALPSSD